MGHSERDNTMTNDNTKKITVQPREYFNIRPHAMVKLTKQGEKFAEVLYMDKGIPKPTIKRLDKDTYMVLKTQKVYEFKHHEEKAVLNIRKTFVQLRGIIRANFSGEGENQCFLTLTYAENMRDPERLMKDFDVFWKRLKREYEGKRGHKLEYVAVAEPQARGAWHMHVMIKSNQDKLFIPQEDLTTFQPHPKLKGKLYKDPVSKKPVITGGIWGHGFASCERLKGDDRGRYYEAYFTSLEVDDVKIVQAKDGKMSKRYKKGARLPMYPVHFKLYRCSRGIIRPKSENKEYRQATEDYALPYKVSAFNLIDDNGEIVNAFQRESYKVKSAGQVAAENFGREIAKTEGNVKFN